MKTFRNQFWRCTLSLLLILPELCLAEAHRSDAWARAQFATAAHKREVLEGSAPEQQTRHSFQDVIASYRRVYYGSPTSTKADSSVMAVADLMAEMGRHFQDSSLSLSAIHQYEFLRREYPGSKYRFQALFAAGEIYKNDLKDKSNAQKTFEEFLRRYPANTLAPEVRAALAGSPDTGVEARSTEALPAPLTLNSVAEDRGIDQGNDRDSDQNSDTARIGGIHFRSNASSTRVEIDINHNVPFKSERIDNPDRIFFDLNAKLSHDLIGKNFDVGNDLLKKIRVAQFKPHRARIVLEIGDHSNFTASFQENPSRLVIEIVDGREAHNKRSENLQPAVGMINGSAAPAVNKRIVEADGDESTAAQVAAPSPPALTAKATTSGRHRSTTRAQPLRDSVREAQPTAGGDRSLIRALGLKIGKIVIDPGHGGHDTGTIGPNSLLEKDLVLEVGRRLGKLLESRLGAQVVYTRKDDSFIPLETRTSIANQEQADLFVSIHANSSRDPTARGVETYYLNFTSSKDALEVAARENAVSETSIHELQDLVKQIALKEKIEESREFASNVQQELHNGLAATNPGLRNRGVKKAPFIVLIGANMPSILAEISFVSNPGDERRLRTSEYRQKIAESLYRGISKYVGGLSGVKVASRIDKPSGQ